MPRNPRIAVIVLLCAVVLAAVIASWVEPDRPVLASAGVKVEMPNGHGSGVHIGKGYIVTAAHVAQDNAEVDVKADTGKTVKAEVLWVNKKYDIALLRMGDYRHIAVADLSCDDPTNGENIRAFGNPMNLEFVSTYGVIAGKPRQVGPWAKVSPTSIPVIQGQSGGPVYAPDGSVAGIIVGGMIMRLGLTPTMTGLGYIVPGSVVCDLMGRE